MICPKCETKFHEKNAKFCTECGTLLVRNRSMDDFTVKRNPNSLTKIDVLIKQNNKIIELLEDLNKSSK